MRAIVAAAMFVSMASAQTTDWFAGVHADLTTLKYPEAERIMWRWDTTVQLRVEPASHAAPRVTVLSGKHPFDELAEQNLGKWRFSPPVPRAIVVDYGFRLSAPDTRVRQVPRGDAVDRFFLRLFRLPTYKQQGGCQASDATFTDVYPLWSDAPTVVVSVVAQMTCEAPPGTIIEVD